MCLAYSRLLGASRHQPAQPPDHDARYVPRLLPEHRQRLRAADPKSSQVGQCDFLDWPDRDQTGSAAKSRAHEAQAEADATATRRNRMMASVATPASTALDPCPVFSNNLFNVAIRDIHEVDGPKGRPAAPRGLRAKCTSASSLKVVDVRRVHVHRMYN